MARATRLAAASLAGEPEEVWPWLAQLGWHLGGWYTPAWVDRLLFPGNWPSLDWLDPALVRGLRAGDLIPDGPPGTAFFRVATAEPPHALVLRSATHVPQGWKRYGAAIDWTEASGLRLDLCSAPSQRSLDGLRHIVIVSLGLAMLLVFERFLSYWGRLVSDGRAVCP